MANKYQTYKELSYQLPTVTSTWNLYGAGMESIGKDEKPEDFPVPTPGENQLLVRIDSVGLCFSDLKVVRLGPDHPKLYGRDMKKEPGRLGHEVSLTIMAVGNELKDDFKIGQRYAVQPDIYQDGKSTAYGYTVPGGLVQYHLIGPEVLDTDEGACLLPVQDEMTYAAASLLEPWGCVLAAYTQRRILEPQTGGTMWIIGNPEDKREYQFSQYLDAPTKIVLSDVPASLKALAADSEAEVVTWDNFQIEQLEDLITKLTDGHGFDDIVMLAPTSADTVGKLAKYIIRRGRINLMGTEPLDDLVQTDVGRLHYDYIAFMGNAGTDIADSYGEERNRCELKTGGSAIFIGAGGPMGQMHVQRAIENPEGPKTIIATEVNESRIAGLESRFIPLAKKHNRELFVLNPTQPGNSLEDLAMEVTDGKGVDDAVVCVPVAGLMAESAKLLNPDGMLVLFAGVPNGTLAPLNLSNVYLANAMYTGTSGLTMDDQRLVLSRSVSGALSPELSVAAIGGMKVAKEGIQALQDGRYPGKIVVFPQLANLPLLGLDELSEKIPSVAEKLGAGNAWTVAAEKVLFEMYWNA